MVKHRSMKYMDIEGVEELLFDLASDPDERVNLIDNPAYADTRDELRALCRADWDRQDMYDIIFADQRRRLKIHDSTSGDPTYVNIVRDNDADRYIRNAGAADTKAKARLPYVQPTKPPTN